MGASPGGSGRAAVSKNKERRQVEKKTIARILKYSGPAFSFVRESHPLSFPCRVARYEIMGEGEIGIFSLMDWGRWHRGGGAAGGQRGNLDDCGVGGWRGAGVGGMMAVLDLVY